MPRFIATHTAPFTEDTFKELTKQGSPPEGFTWNLTYCDFDDNKFFCDWEAPSKEALEAAFKAQNMPFDAVYPVKIFNVAKAEFE
jgi:hypothetical protein